MTMRPEPYEHLREDRIFDALERFEHLAAEQGTTTAALSIAWLLADVRVAGVVVGPRRPGHLEPALAALDVAIDRDAVDRLFG
jgi:aryl-alcohol dehydrogenase-like predicted oxidoreductase